MIRHIMSGMILLLLLVELMLCLFYLFYLLPLTPLLMIFCFANSKIGRNLWYCSKINSVIFLNSTQRIQIDNVLSDFANISSGVPQGSVL